MKKWLLALPLLLLTPTLFAANLFTPSLNDQSLLFLSTLFGNVGHVLERGGSNLLKDAFVYFNNGIIVLGTVVIVYSLVVSTINTANDGETLGKKWNSVWIPARSALGFSLLLPTGVGVFKGYCLAQVIVMWVIVQGVGAADKLWSHSVDVLASGQAMPNMSLGINDAQQDAFDLTSSAFQSEVCSYQLAAQMTEQFATAGGDTKWGQPQKFHAMLYPIIGGNQGEGNVNAGNSGGIAGTTVYSDSQPAIPVGYKFGIFPSQYIDSNGNQQTVAQDICGSITTYGANADTTTSMESLKGNAQFASANQSGYNSQVKNTNVRFEAETSAAVGIMIKNVDQIAQQYVIDYINGEITFDSNGELVESSEVQSLQYGLQSSALAYQSRLDNLANQQAMDLDYQHADKVKVVSDGAKASGWSSAGTFYIYMSKLFNTEARSYDFTQANGSLYDPKTLGNLIGTSNPNGTIVDVSQPLGPMLNAAIPLSDSDAISTGIYNSVDTSRWDIAQPTYDDGGYNFCSHTAVVMASNVATMGTTSMYCMGKVFVKGVANVFNHGKKKAKALPEVMLFMAQMLIYISLKLFSYLVGGSLNPLVHAMNTGVAAQNNAMGVMPNPIVSLQMYGYALLTSIEHLWFRMLVFLVSVGIANFACSGQNTPLGIFTSLMSYSMPILAAAMLVFLFVGATMAFYVPLIPYLLFTFGVLSWLMLTVEAMVAAPIMALGIIHPEGQHDVWGHANQGVMLLVSVFLRPSLMIIGFLAASLMAYVAVALVNAGFYVAANSLLPLNNEQVREAWSSDYASLFACVVIWLIYAMTIILALNQAFKLIHQIPDKVMRWIGMTPENTEPALDEIKSQVKVASDAGGSAMKGVGEMNKAGQEMLRGNESDSAKKKPSGGEISGSNSSSSGGGDAAGGAAGTGGAGGAAGALI